jgi:hypothetical protein
VAQRFEKGKLRPQPARLKDVAKRSANGAVNHDKKGRFAAGNTAAGDRRLKVAIKRQLGREATGEAVERLYRDTKSVFLALVRSVGSDAPAVQDTLARRARWGVLSAWYSLRAVELGLETKEGQACLELALKLDARAERLDVTALDLANKLDSASPVDPLDALNRRLDAVDLGGSR